VLLPHYGGTNCKRRKSFRVCCADYSAGGGTFKGLLLTESTDSPMVGSPRPIYNFPEKGVIGDDYQSGWAKSPPQICNPLSHKINRVKRDTAKGWWPLRSVKGVESTHGSQLSDHTHKEPINSGVSESLLGSVHPLMKSRGGRKILKRYSYVPCRIDETKGSAGLGQAT